MKQKRSRYVQNVYKSVRFAFCLSKTFLKCVWFGWKWWLRLSLNSHFILADWRLLWMLQSSALSYSCLIQVKQQFYHWSRHSIFDKHLFFSCITPFRDMSYFSECKNQWQKFTLKTVPVHMQIENHLSFVGITNKVFFQLFIACKPLLSTKVEILVLFVYKFFYWKIGFVGQSSL